MQVVQDILSCREMVEECRREGRSIGLVPTMGALHEGHLSLVRQAQSECDRVAVTIFVNPTQFGPNEDFSAYPRPIEADLAACETAKVWLVFTPSAGDMYPAGSATRVEVRGLSDGLCGRFRPGHFVGVATVVAKLFHILPADVAYFGEKDYQQLTIIRQMVRDLNFPIRIVGCPTLREADGLAKSSRNIYLTAEERSQASSLSRGLFAARDLAAGGESDPKRLVARVRREIENAGPATIEYIETVDASTLQPLLRMGRAARICLAVRIGACRLIDNVALDAPKPRG